MVGRRSGFLLGNFGPFSSALNVSFREVTSLPFRMQLSKEIGSNDSDHDCSCFAMNRSDETRLGSRTTGAPPTLQPINGCTGPWTLEKSKALELLSSQETPYVDSGICRWDQGDVFGIDGESFNYHKSPRGFVDGRNIAPTHKILEVME